MKNDIQERLKKEYLTQEWLRYRLAKEDINVNKCYLSEILKDKNGSDSVLVKQVLYASNKILTEYERAFPDRRYEVGDLVCGESNIGEYVAGVVVSVDPCVVKSIGGTGKEIECLNARRL